MTGFAYWRPEPRRHDFMWFALLVPAIIYAAGVIVYAHAAFSPADIAENGHAVGSALMVFGGESGTLAAAAEVFRKAQTRETNWADWAGLFVSLVATLGNLFVVYSVLDAGLDAPWLHFARRNGPLALLLCSGLDFYAGVMEFGFYNAIYDRRMDAYLLARHNARLAHERRTSEQEAPQEQPQAAQPAAHEAQEQPQSGAQCGYCGRTFRTPNGVSAHLRFCAAYQRAQSEEESDA